MLNIVIHFPRPPIGSDFNSGFCLIDVGTECIKDYVGRLKENKKAMVLTVNGRAELVVQDAESYQLLLERLERAETLASIRRGIEQFDRGEGIAVDEAEAKLRKKQGFSR